jgi:hypothetical protein
MKISTVLLGIFVVLGLFIAWDVCLAQEANIALLVGACDSCSNSDCIWHAVDCEAKSGETCGKSDSCCKQGGSGICSALGNAKQCKYTGCVTRRDESCAGG